MTERTVGPASLWQHPYVDVFKHYRLDKNDWKQNKKHGDVQEIFAKEIGRKAFQLNGSISANNYIQIPHPQCPTKSLALTGRYLYLELMTLPGIPVNFHFDFGLAERTQNLRISVSNLFKNFTTSNGNVIQIPLELKAQKWATIRLDIQDLLERSQLFPKSYKIESCHQLKAMQLCANCLLRGVYTSDNDYEFTNLPADMKFKFGFDIQRWPEFFQWQSLPQQWDQAKNPDGQTGKHVHYGEKTREEERKIMDEEINELLRRGKTLEEVPEAQVTQLESAAQSRKGNSSYMGKSLLQQQKERQPLQEVQGFMQSNAAMKKSKGEVAQATLKEQKKSSKMDQDPILELDHIIGYSPDKCQEIQWIKKFDQNIALFASGGTLIAMNVEDRTQTKFYFGHSAPISCFDTNANGSLLASGQEGKNPLVRIWEYESGRCLTMFTLNVNSIQCLSFSHDGKFLATVGRGNQNREQIVVWDISGIGQGQQPKEYAKQSAEFNIISLKFSPLDSEKLVSCGKENVRFWRIRQNKTIRGSAVVLNHHARNSVFTCLDFDHSFFSSDKQEEQKLSRVFVGSKHGQIYQINYYDEKLEGNFAVSEGAIFSVSVNAAFCAVGSEDQYMRAWSLDFSEFYMEAKHETTVCSVDISPDGLKVACGTLSGAVGIAEKANSKYQTLLRAHTSDILSMDMQNDKIITASRDNTIRIWDMKTFDQDYEFSTPVDLPLSVAAHPTLPLFSCGFESGVLRVFDIEKTCVCDEFVQFNKPLTKLAYSPKADLLVTCCQDGSVAVHNAQRQHLPTKMMHLEFPPQFVHVAFTQEQEDSQGLFATMGEHGNSVRIHESETFAMKHSINTGHILTAFAFAQNNRELVCSTQDCKLLFFSLTKYEGVFIREITTVHRGLITSLDISQNSGFIVTGGQDNMVKVWDYEAPKALPQFYQAFIGHINPVNNVKFLKGDNTKIVSTGMKDGIYAWTFHGDVATSYAHEFGATEGVKKEETSQASKPQFGQSILQRMRQTKKREDKFGTGYENGFALPPFKQLQGSDPEPEEKKQVLFELRDYQGPYKFYNSKAAAKIDLKVEEDAIDNEIKPVILNGYDGTNGVHDNLHWLSAEGWQVYTLHNKVIFEKTKTRDQQVLTDSSVQLSTLAVSPDRKYIAVGEGSKNLDEVAYVLIYEIERTQAHPFFALTLKNKLSFHQRGVQSLAFSNCSRFLISAGIEEEGTLAVSDVATGLVLKSSSVKSGSISQIAVDPFIITEHIQFTTVGMEGSLMLWRMDSNAEQLQYYEVQGLPSSLAHSHFVTCAYTENLGGSYNTYFTLIGTSDGSLAAFDNKSNTFLQAGHKQGALRGQIGHIRCNEDSAVIGSSGGSVARYFIKTGEDSFTPFPLHNLKIYNLDSAVTSISMDDMNNEGLLGTENGTVYYINFEEKILLKLIVTHHGHISSLKFGLSEEGAQELLLTASDGAVSVRSAQTMDQVLQFKTPVRVSQVLQCPTDLKKCIFVHENGLVQFVSLNKLKVEGTLKLSLQEDEKVCAGAFNSNGINFAIGTTRGSVVFGRIQQNAWTSPLRVSISIVNDLEAGAVTHIAFSPHDTIGTFLAAFDSGVVKQWQSTIQNDQFRKLMDLLPQNEQCLDLADEGAQRVFQVNDEFYLFENPHGLDEMEEEDRQRLKDLYGGRKHPNTHCFFAPKGSADLYFATVEALQYIFVRNSVTGTVVQRVSLMAFPTSLTLEVADETQGEAVVAYVGCKEGVLLKTQIDATSSKLLGRTREGGFYGAITSVDVFRDIVAVGNKFGETALFVE